MGDSFGNNHEAHQERELWRSLVFSVVFVVRLLFILRGVLSLMGFALITICDLHYNRRFINRL